MTTEELLKTTRDLLDQMIRNKVDLSKFDIHDILTSIGFILKLRNMTELQNESFSMVHAIIKRQNKETGMPRNLVLSTKLVAKELILLEDKTEDIEDIGKWFQNEFEGDDEE
ncbi:MAG: hypothetical protein GX638_02565 [Crenarchaeota archaeon]|nr:hypothetical protein [Thermoproteota archaeon]